MAAFFKQRAKTCIFRMGTLMRIRFSTLASTILAGAVLAAVPSAPSFAQEAQADSSDDVLIMRRKITEPNTKPRGPDGQRVATGLGDVGAGINAYRANGEIKLAVSALGCLKNDVIVPEANCTGSKGGAEIGNVLPFPARMDPDLKAVHVTREAFAGSLPYAPSASIDALCESRVSIGSESWRLSCDPQSIVNQYQKYVSRLSDPAPYTTQFPSNPNPSAEANFVNLTVTDYGCRSTITGSDLAKSTCSSIKREPNIFDIVSIPAELVPQLRKAYVTRDSLRTLLPNTKTSQIDAICTMPVKIEKQDWRIVCGTAQEPENFMRVIGSLRDPYEAPGSLGTDYTRRNKVGGTGYDWMVASTKCIDSSTGATVANTECQYLSSGANVYDVLSLGATHVHDLREIYFDQQDLTDAASYGATFAGYPAANLCAGNNSLYVYDDKNTRITYTAKCGQPDSPDNYERVAAIYRDPSYFTPTGGNSNRNNTTRSDFDFTVSQTTCWDIAANKVAQSSSKCSYIPDGASIYDIATVKATYVPQLRTIHFDQAQLEALFPRGGNISYTFGYSATVSAICSGTGEFRVLENGNPVFYKPSCGAPEDPANYERVGSQYADPYYTSYSGSNSGRNINTRDEFDFIVTGTRCWDLANNKTADQAKCAYLPEGPSIYDVATVKATYVPDLRETYFDKADLETLLSRGGDFKAVYSSGYSVASLCSGAVTYHTREGAGIYPYTVRCGTPDDPARYDRIGYEYHDPYHQTYNGSDRTRNKSSRSEFDLIVSRTACWDKDTSKIIPDPKCAYLPRGTKLNDVVTVSATYVPQLREVYLDRNELAALVSKGGGFKYGYASAISLDSFCSGTASYNVMEGSNLVSYTVRCGTPDDPANYERYARYLADPYYEYNSSTSSMRLMNTPDRDRFTFTTYTLGCWSRKSNTELPSGRCSNLAEGPKLYEMVSVPATIDTSAREVRFARSDLQAMLSHNAGFYLNYGYRAADQMCASRTLAIYHENRISYYNVRCN